MGAPSCYITNKPGFICSGSPARVIRYTIYCPTCEAGRVVYGIKPDHREGFILSISKDLLVISFSGKNSHAFYSGRDISDTFSPADIYIL